MQGMIFGWSYARPSASARNPVTRFGYQLRVGMQEFRTWAVGGVQTDLGSKDASKFGVEWWPFVSIEMSLY